METKKEEKRPVLTGEEKKSIGSTMVINTCIDQFLIKKFGDEYTDFMSEKVSELLSIVEENRKKKNENVRSHEA